MKTIIKSFKTLKPDGSISQLLELVNRRARGYYSDGSGLIAIRSNNLFYWYRCSGDYEGTMFTLTGTTETKEGAEFIRVK